MSELITNWDWQASKSGHFPAALMVIAVADFVHLFQIYHISTPKMDRSRILARSKGLIPQASLSFKRIAEEVIGHTFDGLKMYAAPIGAKKFVGQPKEIGLPGDKITLRNGAVTVAHGKLNATNKSSSHPRFTWLGIHHTLDMSESRYDGSGSDSESISESESDDESEPKLLPSPRTRQRNAIPMKTNSSNSWIMTLMLSWRFILRQGSFLAKPFARWLRDAILVPDKIDKARGRSCFKKKGITWDQAVRSKSDWVWQRVRRYIPAPDVLEPVLKKLFATHADLLCSKKKFKLFDAECHKAAAAMLDDVRKGWISDPPGVALYNRLRTDETGLVVRHCNRGTSNLEGSVHGPIKKRFVSLGASVEMSVALLSDFCYRKMLRDGIEYDGHYDPWIENENDLLFQSLPFDEARKTRPGHRTRYEFALVPIHTNEEYALFNKAVRPGGNLRLQWTT
ncbi:hypothetical protein B0H13DRAFT_1868911 [Mycena leptocephala]|nr:hypothetical protein B0H13DRAFT_1868911 [Mycena leptocephala]